jgi:hypothetical protein
VKFPGFGLTTPTGHLLRKLHPVNGFWFPTLTFADDTLYFRSQPQRERLTIHYSDYKKFGSESSITFEKP